MPRNDFIMAWLVVVTFLLILIMGVTLFFVFNSGILSGEGPLMDATTEEGGPLTSVNTSLEQRLLDATGALDAKIYCIDPTSVLLLPEDRKVEGSPTKMGIVRNVLEALRATPTRPDLRPAVPPEIQFRSVFADLESSTLYVDLTAIPQSWKSADPIEVGLCLYAITHTMASLGPEYQFVRFLVEGKEATVHPGGFILSEPFSPSEEWLGTETPQ